MSKIDNFLNKIKKSKFNAEEYEPKFKVDDIIVNDKFKVISKIQKIVLKLNPLREMDGTPYKGITDKKVPHYILKDYENKAAQNYFNEKGMKLDKSTRLRYKECRRIDSTYKLLDPVKANILFGDNK